MTRESIRREKVAAVTLPPCKSCGSPWAQVSLTLVSDVECAFLNMPPPPPCLIQERGFFCDGRHSRACRVCSTGYCADCKFIHMLKTSALAQTELLSTNMGSSGSGNGSSRSSGGGGGNNNPWVCRTCAGDMGFTVGGPCVVCEAPWVERSTFLGRNSMHSRECVACLRSFCHSCKLRHMVKEGTSAALMNRLRNGGGSNGCGGSFPGSFRESVSGGADSFTESRADFMRHSDGGSGGCGCGGGGGGGIGSRGSLANQPSGPHLARPQFRRYECLDCRAEHAYRPERGSNAESAQPQPPTPILQREAPPPYSRNSPSTISVNNNSGAIGGGGGSGGGGSGSGHAGQNAGEHKDASERQTNRHRSHESGNKTVNDRRMRAALKGEAATARPASSRTIAL